MRLLQIRDPMALELSELAREGSAPASAAVGANGEMETRDMSFYFYGDGNDEDAEAGGRPPTHDREPLRLSDRFSEENVIDILANVDVMDDESMVTHREDDLAKTIAGVAGNVLEW